MNKSIQLKKRPSSANRQRQQPRKRRSSFDTTQTAVIPHVVSHAGTAILPCIDLRTLPQKITDLKREMRDSGSESHLHHLLLMQVYVNLEYGDISIENARAYLNLGKYYFQRKQQFLPQSKFHALHARDILEQLKIQPMDYHLEENLLAYEIYKLLLQCSLIAKQRESKTKNKHILAIDKSHLNHDFKLLGRYLEKMKDHKDFDRFHREYLMFKFEVIILQPKDFNQSILTLMDEIPPSIDSYLRCGCYLINFKAQIAEGLMYYRKAIELAEGECKRSSSIECQHQLAKAILQRCIAKVRLERVTDDLEREFQRAIQLYQQPNGDITRDVLQALDELATFYTKLQKYQDALNILCETLPDKIRLYGDFAEEVIQTELRIGAIYLREGECLNAVEHLKTALDLQEFVYGSIDPRTCQTRNSVEFLKKDPMVSQTYFVRMKDRPMFQIGQKISHEKKD